MVQRASTILDDAEAKKYVWGLGFHWYEDWSGGEPMFNNVCLVNEMYPDVNLIFTEGCNEKFDVLKGHIDRIQKSIQKYGK
jgi:glucosylceramidase